MLEVRDVRKSFDGFMAVNEGNLTVERGKIVAVIGPNGAGKSTLFKLITGHLKPDGGSIRYKGEDIAGLPPYTICRRGISLSFQIVNIFHRLSVFDNVQAAILSRQRKTFNLFTPAARLAREETMRIIDAVGLSDRLDAVSSTLAYGDQKVLEIAIALGNDPELLILDEPTAGMSPEETAATIGLIRRLTREMGLTILFCEHDMELVFAIADEIMVMRQGATIIQGPGEVVRADPDVQEAYLGGGH
ncbi:leucine/isoleucine/valine transporter subunit; ATP-binding component of ABC superfamily [uncultured Desulfatiglans sp.]|uniref:Leucine/isoleucine/valine transporter subunit ATP-binding component of ABC superfamily n=1 Tax=Uncultured Desulfatiglans sp. TaxID=1748965 RepID=A0A653AFZ4_UNCDX|nr:leucine/isoleucine/valine transporter subunit; ATP-binding component of ABC superfamily [uncultured Desulfatiglans sp.]